MVNIDPFKKLDDARQDFISLKETCFCLLEEYKDKGKNIHDIANCLINELCNKQRYPVYEQLPGGLLKITDDKYDLEYEELPYSQITVRDSDSHTFLFNLLLNIDNKGEDVFSEDIITRKKLDEMANEMGGKNLNWRVDLYNADYDRFGLKRSELKLIFGFDFIENKYAYPEKKPQLKINTIPINKTIISERIILEVISGLSFSLSQRNNKFKKGEVPNAKQLATEVTDIIRKINKENENIKEGEVEQRHRRLISYACKQLLDINAKNIPE